MFLVYEEGNGERIRGGNGSEGGGGRERIGNFAVIVLTNQQIFVIVKLNENRTKRRK